MILPIIHLEAPSRDLPDLFHVVLALCPAFPGNLRGNLQLRSRTRFLHCRRSADLLWCDVPLWNPARLPDDFRCHRICGMLDHRGSCA